jgi:hypothetical protein
MDMFDAYSRWVIEHRALARRRGPRGRRAVSSRSVCPVKDELRDQHADLRWQSVISAGMAQMICSS